MSCSRIAAPQRKACGRHSYSLPALAFALDQARATPTTLSPAGKEIPWMPSFARELETTLHNALGEASKRRHEYATLEHLLIALVDDTHASQVMTSCGVNRDELKATVKAISRQRARRSGRRQRDRPDSDQRFPARRPARDPPRPVVGPRRGRPAPMCWSPCSASAKATRSIFCSSRT